jgi:predicted secreted protein
MSQAFTFTGGAVKTGDAASPEVFTGVSEVQTVSFSGDKVDVVDVTHALSPGGNREFIATLGDNGTMQFTANWLPADTTHINLKTKRDAKAPINWQVTLVPSAVKLSFAGIITGIDRNLDFNKEAKLTVKVKITGTLTIA